MQDVWSGKAAVAELQARAKGYFVHPANSSRFDSKVFMWAEANPQALKTISDEAAMRRRAERHGLGDDSDESFPESKVLAPDLRAQWDYLNDHYGELTMTADAFPRRLG